VLTNAARRPPDDGHRARRTRRASDSWQLDQAERIARQIVPLGRRLDAEPWRGARPCLPDMLPIIGAAPRHRGLWFAFGHAHHGFTLAPRPAACWRR
jgi:glycine/D-amino acid oxidase-like deaminating enzyme